MASKAKLTALGSAAHLVDAQTLFSNPGDIHYLGDFATIEFGDTTSTYSLTGVTRGPKAEGGFVKTMSFGKLGAYLGHRSDTTTDFIDAINVSTFAVGGASGTLLTEQNPLDIFWGTEIAGMKTGFDFHYSNSSYESGTAPKTTKKANTMGISGGVRNDIWNAYFRMGLSGKTESDNAVLKPVLESKGLVKAGGGRWYNTIYAFANYEWATGNFAKSVAPTSTDITKNQYEVGMVNNQKVDAGNFFYGVSYLSTEVKSATSTATTTTSATTIPMLVGLEIDANSWMKVRGSVKQSILIADRKNETTNINSSMYNDTTISAGVGFVWNKLTMDATLAGSTTGDVNGNTLLANSSLTYNF